MAGAYIRNERSAQENSSEPAMPAYRARALAANGAVHVVLAKRASGDGRLTNIARQPITTAGRWQSGARIPAAAANLLRAKYVRHWLRSLFPNAT